MRRATPLADILAPVLGPALAAQGFSGHDIVASWGEIVGERLADRSRPLRIDWPRRRSDPGARRPEPATLVVQVDPAFALDLQHEAPVLIDRINAYFGWACVGRIVLRQAPIGRRPRPPGPPVPPSADAVRRVTAAATGVAEPLAASVRALGVAVLAEGEADRHDRPGTFLPRS